MNSQRRTLRLMPCAIAAGQVPDLRRHDRGAVAFRRRVRKQFIMTCATSVLGRDERLMNEEHVLPLACAVDSIERHQIGRPRTDRC